MFFEDPSFLTKYPDPIFQERFKSFAHEFYAKYNLLYHDDSMFHDLVDRIYNYYIKRCPPLKKIDEERMNSSWFRKNDIFGVQIYVENFSGTFKNLETKLDYLEMLKVKMIYLMPFLDSPEGKSDGGFACSDYKNVRSDLGTMDDLQHLIKCIHERGMIFMGVLVINHTSDEHEWAKKAKAGDEEYQKRYHFYDNWLIPNEFERTKGEFFPEVAPGNFTWVPECHKIVMTTYHPYQWDLNYENPIVFNEMADNLLFLANKGVDIFSLNSPLDIWKEVGTECYNLPNAHIIMRLFRIIIEIVCPGVIFEEDNLPSIFPEPENAIFGDKGIKSAILGAVGLRDVQMLKEWITQRWSTDRSFYNFVSDQDEVRWSWGLTNPETAGYQFHTVYRYLNDIFSGRMEGSKSRGVVCFENLVTCEARVVGTLASLAGLEYAVETNDQHLISESIKRIVMTYSLLISLPGIPILYSGDELGLLNYYDYINEKNINSDVRFIVRNKFPWEKVEKLNDSESIQHRIFYGIVKLMTARTQDDVFSASAKESDFHVVDIPEVTVLVLHRFYQGRLYLFIFNMYEYPRKVFLDYDGDFTDIITGEPFGSVKEIKLPSYSFKWLMRPKTSP
ncbi:Amylosucrase [Tritrichomonas foetus]|uniref:Amylosucrase n=1 Tax=Tritrichomonas foetus TaxID=1144522 RepID=A0A1J4K2F7_9EUKA|nr:Amylosucrase [Tritrichomonas foetus]|eukprot:OHT04976.1 Amylosucrase [Tritrichomonas foetus]